jgi:hypothetical protein
VRWRPKERWLQARNDPASARLCDIAEQRGRLTAEQRELSEACAAGERALEHLGQAVAKLESARSWSAYDTWFDGGIFASAIKHDRLDEVAARLRAADAALKVFTTELSDVHMAGVELVELSPLTRTFDVWFDNLFTDLAVRGRIIDAQQKVRQASGGVREIRATLNQRMQRCADELARLSAERVDLLS